MFLLSSLSLISIFITNAFAQSSQSLFVPTFPVVAYPLATGNGATTYLVGCTAGSDTSTCNFAQPYTLVQGQNTVQFALTATSQAVDLGCAIQGNTYMACSATGGPSSSIVTAYTTFTGSEVATHFRAIALETDSKSLLTWPTSTIASTTASSTSSIPAPTVTSSANITSSILEIFAPETTATASTNTATSLITGPVSVTSVGGSSSGTTTTSLVSTSATASASHTKAVASGLGNAGTPGASSDIGRVISGAVGVVVAVAAGIF